MCMVVSPEAQPFVFLYLMPRTYLVTHSNVCIRASMVRLGQRGSDTPPVCDGAYPILPDLETGTETPNRDRSAELCEQSLQGQATSSPPALPWVKKDQALTPHFAECPNLCSCRDSAQACPCSSTGTVLSHGLTQR